MYAYLARPLFSVEIDLGASGGCYTNPRNATVIRQNIFGVEEITKSW